MFEFLYKILNFGWQNQMQEDMAYMMEVGQGCLEGCFGPDFMTMRQDDGKMGLVEFAEVTMS